MQIFGLTTTAPAFATHVATTAGDVPRVLAAAEAAASAGRWAVVMVAYDAASAFERAMRVQPGAGQFPLAWAAEYEELHPAGPSGTALVDPPESFTPLVNAPTFCDRVREVQRHIAAGDTYQVNLTFPMECRAPANVAGWFARLQAAQEARYSAYLEIDGYTVLSLSPELFFEMDDSTIRTRPMKGTTRRGRWLQEDEALARALAASRKAQAENVMIVDLLRNDLGRIARTGSVRVRSLFDIEQYPTLWQMTSTVEGTLNGPTEVGPRVGADDDRGPRSRLPLTEVFAALFPCGSVTGAPKIRTVDIIGSIEDTPRGLYTGTIGLIRPDGRAVFNVAIRTIVVDQTTGVARMGVGAGITADSVPEEEYEECLLKGAFAAAAADHPAFNLLETMRLEDGTIRRLDRHVRRLAASAAYFGIRWDEAAVRASLAQAARRHPHGIWRLRVTLSPGGVVTVTDTAYEDTNRQWHIALSSTAVNEHDPFLFNKTTNRTVYDTARRARPDVDDVLLWNSRGEVTETTIANLVVEIDGQRFTPPIECGLLPGTLRAEMLDAGDIRERVITRGEVLRAPRLWLINSLRGWIEAVVVR